MVNQWDRNTGDDGTNDSQAPNNLESFTMFLVKNFVFSRGPGEDGVSGIKLCGGANPSDAEK